MAGDQLMADDPYACPRCGRHRSDPRDYLVIYDQVDYTYDERADPPAPPLGMRARAYNAEEAVAFVRHLLRDRGPILLGAVPWEAEKLPRHLDQLEYYDPFLVSVLGDHVALPRSWRRE